MFNWINLDDSLPHLTHLGSLPNTVFWTAGESFHSD